MNKKKKNTRIKHRRNQNRVKKILQTSLLKARPKKIIQSTKTDVLVEQVEAKFGEWLGQKAVDGIVGGTDGNEL